MSLRIGVCPQKQTRKKVYDATYTREICHTGTIFGLKEVQLYVDYRKHVQARLQYVTQQAKKLAASTDYKATKESGLQC